MKRIKIISACILFSVTLLAACTGNQKQAATTPAKSAVIYTCPMHPQILEDHPGSCPICGMTLVKKSGQASEQAGISLNTVLQPVNSSVVSTVNAITAEQKTVRRVINADGYLDFDTRTFNNIASRFSGRIEKLYIKSAFQEIHQGERIFDIYSPELVTAQQDLIFLTKNSANDAEMVDAARQQLLLLGMTTAQVNQAVKTGRPFYSLPVYSPYEGHVHDVAHSQMAGATDVKEPIDPTNNLPLAIKEGMYVEKGQTLFNVVNPHQLWAVIKVDQSVVASLKLNQAVTISLPDVPGKTIDGEVDFIEPTLEAGDKTTSIRVYLHNMDHDLKVNSVVKAVIQTGSSSGLWIPRTAIVNLGQRRIIWLKNGPAYQAHEVFTGTIDNNEVQVVKGLSPTDSLAVNAQYLTDSESFIKTKSHD